jgi:hypothetical protein
MNSCIPFLQAILSGCIRVGLPRDENHGHYGGETFENLSRPRLDIMVLRGEDVAILSSGPGGLPRKITSDSVHSNPNNLSDTPLHFFGSQMI